MMMRVLHVICHVQVLRKMNHLETPGTEKVLQQMLAITC